jgi:hypothetical protein
MPETVYILGAGCSRECGYRLAAEMRSARSSFARDYLCRFSSEKKFSILIPTSWGFASNVKEYVKSWKFAS